MVDIEALVNKAFDKVLETCDFSKINYEEQLQSEWRERFKDLYFKEAGDPIAREDFILINHEYPFIKKGRNRVDVVLEKTSGERIAIEFKFLPMKGGTGKNRAIARYVTGILKDIFDLDHYVNDMKLNAKTAFFFLVTKNKNLSHADYACQNDFEAFKRGDRISIADGQVLNLPNGKLTIKWDRDESGNIKSLGIGPSYFFLRVCRKK